MGYLGAHWLLLGAGIELRQTPCDLALAAKRIAATRYPGAQEFVEGLLHPPSEGEMLELFTPWESRRPRN